MLRVGLTNDPLGATLLKGPVSEGIKPTQIYANFVHVSIDFSAFAVISPDGWTAPRAFRHRPGAVWVGNFRPARRKMSINVDRLLLID